MFKEYVRILSYAQDRQHLMPKAAVLVFGSALCSVVSARSRGFTVHKHFHPSGGIRYFQQ